MFDRNPLVSDEDDWCTIQCFSTTFHLPVVCEGQLKRNSQRLCVCVFVDDFRTFLILKPWELQGRDVIIPYPVPRLLRSHS